MIGYWMIALIFLAAMAVYHFVNLPMKGRKLYDPGALYWFTVFLASSIAAVLFWGMWPLVLPLTVAIRLILLVSCVLVLALICQLISPSGIFRKREAGEGSQPLSQRQLGYNEERFDLFLRSASRVMIGAVVVCLPAISALTILAHTFLPSVVQAAQPCQEPLGLALAGFVNLCLFLLLPVALRQTVWKLRCIRRKGVCTEQILAHKRQMELTNLLEGKNRVL